MRFFKKAIDGIYLLGDRADSGRRGAWKYKVLNAVLGVIFLISTICIALLFTVFHNFALYYILPAMVGIILLFAIINALMSIVKLLRH